jgi:hypothetical protein
MYGTVFLGRTAVPYKDPKKQQEANYRWKAKNLARWQKYQREYVKVKRAANPIPHRTANKKWADQNLPRERKNELSREYNRKLRQEVLNAYGNKCACCGETENVFLSMDHIHGGGNQHRKSLGKSPSAFYRWLKRNNFPQEDFRCLCMNCQIGYARNGICPHQILGESKQ